MSVWICKPSLVEWSVDVHLPGLKIGEGHILDSDIIVVVDTENIQESLYDVFCNSGWKIGESFNFEQDDIFKAEEYNEYFDVYINDKIIAKFYKFEKFR